MLYTERYTYYYASLKIACQMELRKAGQTVGKIWLSIGLCSLVLGYIYPSTVRAAKDSTNSNSQQLHIATLLGPLCPKGEKTIRRLGIVA